MKKKDECVNSLHWFGNLFLFERIQQGYDLNPGFQCVSALVLITEFHSLIARAVLHDLLPVVVVRESRTMEFAFEFEFQLDFELDFELRIELEM